MSKPQHVDVDCPSCSKSQPVTVWSSVNATLDPQLKSTLLAGDLNLFTCNTCHMVARIPWDVLYHDMDRKVMIWHVHNEYPAEDHLPDQVGTMLEPITRNYQLRIVTSFPQLVEKIFVFDDGLDDRVVELLKYVMWEKNGPTQYSPDMFLFCEGLTTNPSKERELVFVLLDESGNRGGCTYPWKPYLEAVTFVRDRLGDLSACQGSWLTVNRDFVLRMLGEDGTSARGRAQVSI